MNLKKLMLGSFIAILSTGLLVGCGNANDEEKPNPTEEPTEQNYQGGNNDEQEPDPTEEPSEQQDANDEQEPDMTEEPSEQQDQGENELEEEQNGNN
ncbi:hypothetical protein MUO14_15865 [Halobacillus shinanisalinarum]|uniref:Lipoprotein n=1 Tax=Halobacillus shinanisalinarum TaxID=2932258 RepID=A0ABY4GVC2_9BACI|nr:hypothetical protein [Halobacillus shinanisalinarum]UOQ91974.1 hypothetical protein MUO14_15865 [Halobacillus shinanisalinarum]